VTAKYIPLEQRRFASYRGRGLSRSRLDARKYQISNVAAIGMRIRGESGNQFDRDANMKRECFPFERFRFFSPNWRYFVACVHGLLERFVPNLTKLDTIDVAPLLRLAHRTNVFVFPPNISTFHYKCILRIVPRSPINPHTCT
jgi:hypothetical protein